MTRQPGLCLDGPKILSVFSETIVHDPDKLSSESESLTGSAPNLALVTNVQQVRITLELEAMDQTKANQFGNEQRALPRFGLDVPLRIHFRKGELILGRTVNISESGVSVMVLLEMSIGQPIELDFKLPCGPVNVHAIVKNKNAFRYGLEFVLTEKERTIIKRGCRELAYEKGD